MRVFVSGATGAIGTRAVPLLVQGGHSVTAVARSPDTHQRLQQQGATPVAVDIFNVASIRAVLGGHDAVINLATHIPGSLVKMMLPWSWKENDRVRRLASAALVDAALAEGVPRFVQESFAPMYKDHGDLWIDERWPVAPAPYNKSTLDAERSAERFTAAGNSAVILRFGLLYGPDRLLHEMLDVVKRGWSPLPGPANAFVTSLHQHDAASATVAALTVPAGVYNVGEPDPLRRGEWAASVADAAGLKRPRAMPGWLTHLGGSSVELLSRSQRISSAKLEAAAGWKARYRNAGAAWKDVLAELEKRSA